MAFNPLTASKEIVEQYKRYILTTFKTDFSGKSTDGLTFNEQLKNAISEPGEIENGPILQLSRNYKRSVLFKNLIPDVLGEGFYRLNTKEIVPDRMVLYKHQETAIRKIVQEDRNVVVSTGTGSGKTKSFLIPALDYLLKEEDKGTLCPGVRVMLVYPMNALANDQIGILRDVLKGQKITFGAFTGETEEEYEKALRDYRKEHKKDPLENELISRDRMRKTPPNILITNYSMLEHLLIKPHNNINLFGKPNENHWKYVILDEAHVYTGAKGSEVSLLLRRLRATLHKDELRFILTSATLGSEDENDKVAAFANELCGCTDGCKFTSEDVIRAEYQEFTKPSDAKPIDIQFYLDIFELENNAKLEEYFPEDVEDYLKSKGYETTGDFNLDLFNIVSKDLRIYDLYSLFTTDDGSYQPKQTSEIIEKLGLTENELVAFVRVASLSQKDKGKLFDAKYHLFVKSIDGVYVTLKPDYNLSTHKAKERQAEEEVFKVFTISTCVNCNGIYIVGKEVNNRLYQVPKSESDGKDLNIYALVDENDEAIKNDMEINPDDYCELCSCCGGIGKIGSNFCEHGPEYRNYLKLAKDNADKLCKCVFCEQIQTKRGMLRDFFLGHDSSTAVVATSLFNQLCRGGTTTDKRFLSFSDSRQNAAYFAPYLTDTYQNLVLHRAIYEVVSDEYNKEMLLTKGIPFDKFRKDLESVIDEHAIFAENSEAKTDSWLAMLQDAAKNNSNKSLEFNGLLCYEAKELPPILNDYGLSRDEAYGFFNTILKYVRDKTSIIIPDTSAAQAKDRIYHTGDLFPMYGGKDDKRTDNSYNFLTRNVQKYLDKTIGRENSESFVSWLFRKSDYMDFGKDRNGMRLDLSKLVVKTKNHRFYCTSCHKYYPFSCKNVCIRCGKESLRKVDNEIDVNNNYLHSYTEMDLEPLRMKEHTAQLNKVKARDYQRQFIDKKLNALSCSTTFEMGVDIGELNTVFLRNMPPSPSNYIQRSGRAGRGPNSSAFTVTFCKNSPHDSYYFRNPNDMISGKVNVPNVKSDNVKIAIRHIFATAFGFYWKENYPEGLDTMKEFRPTVNGFEDYLNSKPVELLNFLKEVIPECIQNFRESDTDPNDTTLIDIDLDGFGWTRNLIDTDAGRLSDGIAEYDYDLQTLEDAEINETVKEKAKNTIQDEKTLEFLSRKNIIPKYGFPVDLVQLSSANIYEKETLDLSRDLLLAISDYAPGSKIVADNNLVTSKYVKQVPNKKLPSYWYRQCSDCKSMTIRFDTFADRAAAMESMATCDTCGKPLTKNPKSFIIPKFGFLYTKEEIVDVASSKPVKTYSNETFYKGNKVDKLEELKIGKEIVKRTYSNNDELVAINDNEKLKMCKICKFGVIGNVPAEHKTSNSKICRGTMYNQPLGHIFRTDVFILNFKRFNNIGMDQDSALSILYALIEGFCNVFDIDRRDVSGCLKSDGINYSFIFFDNTPGGAGYVKMLQDRDGSGIKKIVSKALEILESCSCGGPSGNGACYNCLMNYSNQRHHDKLNRGSAIKYLKKLDFE